MNKRKVDAIIIGSGVGGLCTAARLVEKGMKVLVAEKLPYVGGRFSSRKYKGYTITTGAIMVPNGEASAFDQAFRLVDAPLNIRESSGLFRLRLKHGDFETSATAVDLYGLPQFAHGDDAAVMELSAEFMRCVSWWEPLYSITFRDWLAQFTSNTEVHNLFQGFCGAFLGVNSNEVPAGEFFALMKAMVIDIKYGIAVNGNADLMESLANGVKEKGSEVYTRAICKNIIVEGRRAAGAVVEINGKDEEIEAEFVISNAGPNMTVNLAGESNFEKSYMTALREYSFETPVVHIAIGSREPLNEFDGIINFGNTRRMVFWESPSITCPELAPEGMYLSNTFSVPQYASAPLKLRETIDMVMLDLQENFPAFSEADVLMTATHHGEWPAMRRWPGYPVTFRTPVENLYNVGDGCMPKGFVGIEACAVSARQVAEDVLQRV